MLKTCSKAFCIEERGLLLCGLKDCCGLEKSEDRTGLDMLNLKTLEDFYVEKS
jgi:hypothetical protein